ncbi:hypothetical protein MANY_44620 [Mycolicibacterium anyangense]|uniref:Alanine and proline rich membrane protein n=1 Tax=Mycolicibacterium anyangense TaxID=1431246 RepID=A0A6N4WE95_9MYCO|nr:hypothetical protein [Mycolicibacterium anyangense]BBZ79125.1 hypothetical protein MANY_44620 [Mycolicibacterium anyangense]
MVAVVLALIATAVAIGAWFRPAPKPEAPAAKTYSEQEVADAKKAVCDAYERAHRALQTTGSKDGGNDPTTSLAIAVNVRLAFGESSSYLLRTLQEYAATPADLRDQVRTASESFQQISLDQLGEAPQQELDPILKRADAADLSIKKTCGE